MNISREVKEWFCRICGYNNEYIHWDEKIGIPPSHEICECCGVEFGYEDNNINAIRKYRKEWIEGGAKWNEKKLKPKDWKLADQLNKIPKEYL